MVEKRKVSETRTYDVNVYVTHDFKENEVLMSTQEAAEALDEAVAKAKQARKYICSQVEKMYVTPLGIKKGDFVKVETYFPRGNDLYNPTPDCVEYGVYEKIDIERFDDDDSPRFLIHLSNNWSDGAKIASHQYPYRWIPHIKKNWWAQFCPNSDDPRRWKHIILKMTNDDIQKYNKALAEYSSETNYATDELT